MIWAGSLALALVSSQTPVSAGQSGAVSQTASAQQAIPDAPRPQTTLPRPGSIAPGSGTTSTSAGDATPVDAPDAPKASLPSATAPPASSVETEAPPELPEGGQGVNALTIRGQGTNFVEVPFTVKDSKGHLVAGITWRDVQIYENGLRQHIAVFIRDPRPLSVALVIDQSMTQDNMTRVNDALGAVQGAFAPYDEVSLFTYNNGPKMVTDLTGSQSARLTQALERSKGKGRDSLMAGSLSGPMAQGIVINDQNFDPNTSGNRGHGSNMQINPPRDVHTLNDAILAAATSLSHVPSERLRVVYVISDGREYGSTAKTKDVIKYLQTNKISVYGTLVGDSALMGIGFLDRIHLPLMMRDNILPVYAGATGGNFDAEFRTGGIEKSFAEIAKEVRTQYTVGYYTHEDFIDGKYRSLEVKVLRPNLTVIAKRGYYPAAMDVKPHVIPTAQ